MTRVTSLIALMMLSSVTCAQESMPSFPQPLVLDKIIFQTSAKQWVTTQSALLTVEINLTLSNDDLLKARADIMAGLNKIAQGDWHLVQFDRSQDSSGLEKLYVQAQIRLMQNHLTDIYQKAKTISKPGAQYTINGVEFKPSLDEIQSIRAAIRKQLYQQVNDELEQINKAYAGQQYSVSNLVISEGDAPPRPVAYQEKTMNAVMVGSAAAPPLTVSNELVLTAYVEVAANRKAGN